MIFFLQLTWNYATMLPTYASSQNCAFQKSMDVGFNTCKGAGWNRCQWYNGITFGIPGYLPTETETVQKPERVVRNPKLRWIIENPLFNRCINISFWKRIDFHCHVSLPLGNSMCNTHSCRWIWLKDAKLMLCACAEKNSRTFKWWYSRWWFQFFLFSPLSGEMIKFD